MAKLLTSITVLVTVGAVLGCWDDGMVIAEHLPADPSAGEMRMEMTLTEAELEKKAVQDMLQSNCGICHGRSSTRPPHTLTGEASRDENEPIADINDIDALVGAGLIVPGLPEESRLLFLIVTQQMPPSSAGLPAVPDVELRRLEKYIVRLDPPTRTEVVQILTRNCGSCHDRAESAGLPINAIRDLEVLVGAGFIVPGDRDRSALYTRILDGDMPPSSADQPPVPNRDLARLGGYIDLMP